MLQSKWSVLLVACAVVLAACGQNRQAASTTAPASTNEPTAMPTVDASTSYQNPVYLADFPDPAILQVGSTFYAYATNNNESHVQVARSQDLVKWEKLKDGMPSWPSWAKGVSGFFWAPEVIRINETYVMYYTARDRAADRQCIGVATSATPEGPFTDTRDAALVCQPDQGGSIDASPFRDGETLYLYWKNDGNCCGQPTYLYAQELATDGLSLVGEPKQLLRNDAAWEGSLIEAPGMFKHGNNYYLFFSGNAYDSPNYAVGYATCQTALGPCQKAAENPIVQSGPPPYRAYGPGHQFVFQVGNQTWMAYHAWEKQGKARRGNGRQMWLDRLDWQDGKPVLRGPTPDPQPKPEL